MIIFSVTAKSLTNHCHLMNKQLMIFWNKRVQVFTRLVPASLATEFSKCHQGLRPVRTIMDCGPSQVCVQLLD